MVNIHECHEGGAVGDDFAGDQPSVPHDEMLGDLGAGPLRLVHASW
jgi:hypothetical protein